MLGNSVNRRCSIDIFRRVSVFGARHVVCRRRTFETRICRSCSSHAAVRRSIWVRNGLRAQLDHRLQVLPRWMPIPGLGVVMFFDPWMR